MCVCVCVCVCVCHFIRTTTIVDSYLVVVGVQSDLKEVTVLNFNDRFHCMEQTLVSELHLLPSFRTL